MTSRELVIKTLNHEEVERLPRCIWTIPYIHMHRDEEYQKFLKLYPPDVTYPSGIHWGKSPYATKATYRKGEQYTDNFGTVWDVMEDGVVGEVKDPIIKTEEDLDKYKLPWERLDEVNCEGQAEAYKNTDKFVLGGTEVRPFERLQFLRGTEQLFIDIALEDPIFLRLRDMLHEYNLREMKIISAQAIDGVQFMDDWGSQLSLLISPAAWRKYFKPMYKEYCDIINSNGKYAFFHSDGHIEAIYDDLIEIGMSAVNSQLFCMDMEMLGRKYAGKVTFWGEVDRQHILPFGKEEDVRTAVRRIGSALMPNKRTGVIAQLSWETLTPFENVITAFDEFGKL